jgi:hypothetical protein
MDLGEFLPFTVLSGLFLLGTASIVAIVSHRGEDKRSRAIRTFCWIAIPVSMVGCCGSVQSTIGDGGYPQVEWQITFRDAQGLPVPGVRLRVEDLDGHEFFLYPVTDYLPDHIPMSDDAGRMVFHHVTNTVEFSKKTCQVFFVPIVTHRTPRYICRFLRGDTELTRLPFG